ncbi:MAG: ATP-binding protein [Syntrophobacteraceae bacterium]|jgi:two-component system phosphate regulon sensor histidine kinase PhoR|nr:ATP-binding protein [Syntrophobacteraceae bacterium]
MFKQSSLSLRLLGILWGILVLSLVWPCWRMHTDVHDQIVRDAQAGAVSDLNLVQWLLKRHELFSGLPQVQTWITGISESRGFRITYLDDRGKVLADSQFSLEEISQLGEFGTRPEILQARKGETGITLRLSTLTQREHIFVARQFEGHGALPSGILRLAVPFWQTNRALDALNQGLKTSVLLAFLGMIPAVLIWRREVRKPLETVLETTRRIAAGAEAHVLRFSSDHELQGLADAVNHLARQIKERFRILREEKEQLEAVFEGMQEGVMVLDSRGRIRRINRSLSAIATRAPITIGRQPMEVLMSYEIQEACERLLASRAEETTQRVNLQVELERERIFDVNIVKLREPGKGPVLIIVFHDISEIKRLEKVRQDFVANVSHELRTPLTSIKGYVETLSADPAFAGEPAASFLRTILKNTNHMVMIVDDLLKLARLEAREQPGESSCVNALEALGEAWRSCEPMAGPKGVRLENRLSPEGVFVRGDMDRLVQVFRNLMENGVKYSPEGDVITVSCEEGDTVCTFSVQDNGVGIPSQYQQRVFERFYRVERHRDRESGSTGLGLAICRHIILNFGGQLWLRSPNPGDFKGSTFFFTLPRVIPAPGHADSDWEQNAGTKPLLHG